VPYRKIKQERVMQDNVFEIIKKDHKELMSLLEQMEKTSEEAFKKRETLLQQVNQEIIPHMRAEEKVLYSILKENDEYKEDAMEAIEEHHAGELILNEMNRMSKSDEAWHAKLAVFKEIIQHHIGEEEGKIFKDAEKVISSERMDTVTRDFQIEKEKVKEKTLARMGT
jgi:hemerythrin-like domain-containing protein